MRTNVVSESDATLCSDPARKGATVNAVVQPTAVRQIAEKLAAAICNGSSMVVYKFDGLERRAVDHLTRHEVAERIAKTLESINASSHRQEDDGQAVG